MVKEELKNRLKRGESSSIIINRRFGNVGRTYRINFEQQTAEKFEPLEDIYAFPFNMEIVKQNGQYFPFKAKNLDDDKQRQYVYFGTNLLSEKGKEGKIVYE